MLPPVVDQAWWRRHRDDVVLADVRWYLDGRSGRAAYHAGHLPGDGFGPGRLHACSWSQHSSAIDRPVATGDRAVRWAVRAAPQ